jgi:hypothetical protein
MFWRSTGVLRVVALVLVSAAVACSGSSQTATEAKSNTPRVRSGAPELRGGLVRFAEVRHVVGLEGVRQVSLKGAPLFENPDPRGFCGARLMQPELSKGATAVFEADGITVSDTVLRLDEPTAVAFLDAAIADTKPGCPSYQSQTNTGSIQTFMPGPVIALPSLADQQVAATATVSVNGQTGFLGEVLLRRAGVISLGIIVSVNPAPAQTIEEFARTISSAVRRVG